MAGSFNGARGDATTRRPRSIAKTVSSTLNDFEWSLRGCFFKLGVLETGLGLLQTALGLASSRFGIAMIIRTVWLFQ